jgi:hypothetical protein
VFNNNNFPYGSQITHNLPPVTVELPWPLTHGGNPASALPPPGCQENPSPTPNIPSPLSMDLPLLDVPLQPCINHCLSVSIHAPGNAPPAAPEPPPNPPSTQECTLLATPPLLVPLNQSQPKSHSLISQKKRYNCCPTPPFPPVSAPSAPSSSDLVPACPVMDQTPASPPQRCSGWERRAPDCYGQWSKQAMADN